MRDYLVKKIIMKSAKKYAKRLILLKTEKGVKDNWKREFNDILCKNCDMTPNDALFKKDLKSEFTDILSYIASNGLIKYKGFLINANTVTKAVSVYKSEYKILAHEKGKEGTTLYNKIVGTKSKRGILNVPSRMANKKATANSERQEDRLYNTVKVDSLKAIHEKCEEFLKSGKWQNLAIGIAYFTGRRFGEIAKTISLKGTETEGLYIFYGQLKTKQERPTNGYLIPVLNGEKVVEALRRLHRMKPEFKDKHLDELHNNSGYVSKLCKEEFGLNFHKLRSLYAMSMNHYANIRGVHRATYIGDLLGHRLSNSKASASLYEVIDIKNFDLSNDVVNELKKIGKSYTYKMFDLDGKEVLAKEDAHESNIGLTDDNFFD